MFDLDNVSVKSRKKGGKSSGGDFIKVGVGGSAGSTFIPIIIGYLSGFAFDALYNMMGLFGYNEKINNCAAFSKGDLYQVAGFMGLTMISFFLKNWSIASFAFGVAAGSITPKLLSSYGLPRYIVFNIDKNSGNLSPLGGGIRSITGGDDTSVKKPQITQVGSKAMAAVNDLSKNVSPLEMKKELIQDQLQRLAMYQKDPVSMYNMLLDSGGLDFETMNSGPPDKAGEFKIHGLAFN